jgi:hypothetical protein
VRIGDPISFRNLTVFPLFGAGAAARDYLTLDEALARGLAETTEISETGAVPELRFVNRGDTPVLLLDGEELRGAKQNRVLNLSILAGANAETLIPVSCIEAGRWQFRTRAFASTDRAQHARGRAMKLRSVSASLRATGAARSDQGAVWAEVDRKLYAMNMASPTAAVSDLYDSRADDVGAYAQALRLPPDATGAAFAINGRVLGLEMFDSADVAAKLLGKLVRSWALDALETAPATGDAKQASSSEVANLLFRVAHARPERFQANGEGEHVRFEDEAIVGGALRWRGEAVHTIAYANAIAT